MTEKTYPHGRRGFAGMSPERQREIARLGGQATQDKGVGYRWDKKAAAEAGRKGGLAPKHPKAAK